MTLVKPIPLKTIAEFVNEYDTRLWRVLHHYVNEARDEADHSSVRKIGMEEMSSKCGHNYLSLLVDIDGPKILFVTESKDASTVKRFKQNLTDHNGTPEPRGHRRGL